MHSDLVCDCSPDDIPTFTLHPVRGVVWAAFWGSFLAGGIVMAINYWRMGRKPQALIMLVTAAVVTVFTFAIIIVLPEDTNIPNFVFAVPQVIAAAAAANALQGAQIRNHSRKGGKVASAWPSVGIGILCILFLMTSLFGTLILLDSSYGTVITLGNDEIYYTGDATEEDALKVAGILLEWEYFGSNGATAQVKAVSGQYTISLVLAENAWEDPEVKAVFTMIGRDLVASGLPTPLTIQLCDDCIEPQETLMIEKDGS